MTTLDPLTIPFISLAILVCVAAPVVAAILACRKGGARFRTVLAGAGAFVVFAYILEQIAHVVLLQLIPATKAFLTGTPWVFALYGGLMAGIFEETARLLVFLFVLKRFRSWKDGIGYGVGHGGAEALLIGGLGNVNNLILAVLIATGASDSLAAMVPAGALDAVIEAIAGTAPAMFLVAMLERLFAMGIQVGLSVLVLLAVKHRGWARVGLFAGAVLFHAAIDVPAVFYQLGKLPLWAVEGAVAVLCAASIAFAFFARRFPAFREPDASSPDVPPLITDASPSP